MWRLPHPEPRALGQDGVELALPWWHALALRGAATGHAGPEVPRPACGPGDSPALALHCGHLPGCLGVVAAAPTRPPRLRRGEQEGQGRAGRPRLRAGEPVTASSGPSGFCAAFVVVVLPGQTLFAFLFVTMLLRNVYFFLLFFRYLGFYNCTFFKENF